MAAHNLNLTNRRENAVAAIIARINTRRAAATPPRAAITADDYLQKRLNEVCDSYADQEDRRTAIGTLSTGQKAALGVVDVQDDPTDLGGLP